MQSAANLPETNTVLGQPQLVVDGNQNPLLKVNGASATAWQYTLATLSSLNYQVVSKADQGYEATIQIDKQNYLLKLSTAGTSNTIALFKLDTTFAAPAVATEVLTQISQHGPA